MGTLPRVTIVTPCLEPGPAIEDCIASVARQTYTGEIEHIVIDGGSTDGTAQLLASQDVIWISEPDRGQSDAINKGFAMASGEILTWLNADDVLHRRAVERAVEALTGQPQAGWVYGDLEVRQDGRTQRQRPPHPVTMSVFRDGCPIPGVGTFVSRWALDEVGELDIRLHLAMDMDLWIRLLRAGIPSVYIPTVQATFVLHRGSKTAQPDLSGRYREQVVVLAKADQPELVRRALDRWEWWSFRSDVQRRAADGDWSGVRRAARAALGRGGIRQRKRLGLLTIAVAPRLGSALLVRSRHRVPM